MVGAELLAVSLLAGAESAHFYSSFCPSIFTIRKLAIPERAEGDIRRGMVVGFLLSAALGLVISVIFKHWLPFAFAVGIGAAMYLLYEFHLQGG